MTSATAQPGPLSSDHINYLIFRYLQEGGHEASAIAFHRDWRRPPEYSDPENLPFAQSVRRQELVSVIQDGLYHDELVSRVRKEGRRFNFTTHGAGAGGRPGTAGKGKSRVEQVRRRTDEFPTPPPKRQRKSEEAPHDRQPNGAAEPMEVDAASPSAGDAEEDAEAASPAVQSPEPEIVEVPERYDSMDVAVQTEGKTGPKTSTLYWRIPQPDATILHNTFSPAKGSRTLLTAGEGIFQYSNLPSDFESSVEKVSRMDDIDAGAGSVVTACAWHPEGHALAFAVDTVREIGVGGRQERRHVIKSRDVRTSRTMVYHSPPLLDPAGLVLALRYSWDGSLLLAVRTNGSRATVEVWLTDFEGTGAGHSAKVKAWNVFATRVLDAAWICPLGFMVCGDDGLLQSFKITEEQVNGVGSEEQTVKTARAHNLESMESPNVTDEMQHLSFDKICVSVPRDTSTPGVTFVVAASEERTMLEGSANSTTTRLITPPPHDERITAVRFQPHGENSSASSDDILAVTREDGHFTIHKLQRDVSAQLQIECSLADGSPALAVAWSPSGTYLAVCGIDIVQIWDSSSLMSRDPGSRGVTHDPIVVWRREKSMGLKGLKNGEHAANGEADEPLQETSLSWSADGESLALAVGREVAVIRFRPPLRNGREAGANDVNGHGS